MRITVEISESDVRDICRVTGEKKKGTAIQRLVADALMMKRRRELGQKFVSGEWGVTFAGLEKAKAAERAREKERERLWRRR